MPTPARFMVDDDDAPVIRLRYHMIEATAAQAAGADAGRPSAAQQIIVTSNGSTELRLRCAGVSATYAVVQGSLAGSTGPWTDLGAGLAIGGAEGEEVDVWVRVLVKRWVTTANPIIDAVLFLGSLDRSAMDEA